MANLPTGDNLNGLDSANGKQRGKRLGGQNEYNLANMYCDESSQEEQVESGLPSQ